MTCLTGRLRVPAAFSKKHKKRHHNIVWCLFCSYRRYRASLNESINALSDATCIRRQMPPALR